MGPSRSSALVACGPLLFALSLGWIVVAPGCSDDSGADGRRGRGQWQGRGAGAGRKQRNKESAQLIKVLRAEPRDLALRHRSSGTLRALRSVEIRPERPGIVRSLLVEEGDQVRAGQVLARLDTRASKLLAQRDRLAADNAKRELERLRSVASLGVVAPEEVARQQYTAESAATSAKLSRHQLGEMAVRAPFAGTVTRRLIDVGGRADAGSVMFQLEDLRSLELDLHVPEEEAGRVAIGAPVELALLSRTRVVARVLRRAPVVDRRTGTVKVTVRIDEPPAEAMPGAFVQASVVLVSRPAAPSLPKAAVFEIDGSPHVYGVVDGRTKRVPIQVGVRDNGFVEVLGGLEPDRIVVADADEMAEGTAIRPVEHKELKAIRQERLRSAVKRETP